VRRVFRVNWDHKASRDSREHREIPDQKATRASREIKGSKEIRDRRASRAFKVWLETPGPKASKDFRVLWVLKAKLVLKACQESRVMRGQLELTAQTG
jgi:hypothetical protein